MSFFSTGEFPSCSDCAYATEYIPYYSFPHSNPNCAKGHGNCKIDKICEDYKPITATCGRCKFIELQKDKRSFICVKHDIEVYFNKKTCDDFIQRNDRIRE